MTDQSLSSFTCPTCHAAIANIIRQRSTNPTDVRELALGGLDLPGMHEVLDLGCGFGFMAGVIGERAAPDARILGVDACEENRIPFLEAVAQTGRRGQFECVNLGNALPWPSGSFDLVVASYSLYYFVDVLADIPRLLRPTGLFLAITHSGTTFRALCRAAGIDEVCCPLLALIRRFSAENGGDLLRSWFARVERVEYRNELRFGPQDTEDLLRYVRFKLPLLWPKTPLSGEIPDDLRQRLTNTFRRDGRFIMDKNDAIFRCRARQGA